MITVDRVEDLFEPDGGMSKDALKDSIVQDIKHTEFIGVTDNELSVDLDPPDGSDILITKQIDPKKALGYQMFDSEDGYFDNLAAQLYVPQESDFGG